MPIDSVAETQTLGNGCKEGLVKLVLLLSGDNPLGLNEHFVDDPYNIWPDKYSVAFMEREFIDKIKRETGKSRLRVAFVPYSSDNPKKYGDQFINYARINHDDCDVDVLPVINTQQDVDEAARIVDKADIIYLGGGNTSLMDMYLKLKISGKEQTLGNLIAGKSYLIGFSAGAYLMQDWYIVYSKPERGYGAVNNVIVLVHAGKHHTDVGNLLTILQELKNVDPQTEVYWLEQNGGVMVSVNHSRRVSCRGKDTIYRLTLDGDGNLQKTPVETIDRQVHHGAELR